MGNADGWVTIGFKGDSKQLEKDIKREMQNLEKFEKEAEKLAQKKIKIETEVDVKQFEFENKIKEIKERAEAQKIGLGTTTGTDVMKREKIDESAQARINALTAQYEEYVRQADEKVKNINQNLVDNSHQQELLNGKIEEMNDELEKSRGEGFEGIKESIENISSSVGRVIKKVIRWGLAIFGIRTAYTAIQSAMSTLSSYNEQIGADLQYIRFALATALQPIVETIIKLAYKLLGVINAISVKLFGYNLFANATAEAFKQSSKSAEKMKKSLAGFDEMNILQDTSGGDTGGVGPSIDLSQVDEETSAYVDKMEKTAKKVTSFWEEEWKTYFENAQGNWATLWQGYLLTMEGFYKTFKGIWELIGGLVDIFVGIFTGDVEKIRKGWDKMCQGLADILVGIIDIIIGLIISFVGIILGLLRDLWDGIVNLFVGVGDWIYKNIIKPVGDFFVGMWNNITKGAQDAWNGIKNAFGSVASFFGSVFGDAWNNVKRIFSTGGQIFMGIVDGILNGFKKIVNSIITGINKVVAIPFNGINSVLKTLKKVNILGVKPFGWIGTISVPKIPKLAKGGIINMPGRGIPVGGAIGGEAGREGVIPLTDSQQMALLGEAIGKYITIDLTNITQLDGRQIARKVEQINQNNKFVLNR